MVRSVSEVTRHIKAVIEGEAVLKQLLMQGEVSNFKLYPSGHAYFTLKDNDSAIRCVMFKNAAKYLRITPKNGMEVIVAGRVGVYERDGAYQFYVESMTLSGKGDLALAFEELKNKLQSEGLFDQSHKKPLPPFPKVIGIVTSPAGAVIRDIYRVGKQRNPNICFELYPVQVQGDGAAAQIAEAIAYFNENRNVDLLIVGRGGGSAEDLWSFNEEAVVRAIFASKIPVVSAVGHETDFTLADFAADVRAATPSHAAEMAVPDTEELKRHVYHLMERLKRAGKRNLEMRKSRLEMLEKSLSLLNPKILLMNKKQWVDVLCVRLQKAFHGKIDKERSRVTLAMEKLDAMSPIRVLRRGYGMVELDGRLIKSAKVLSSGDEITLTFADGKNLAKVL